MALSDKIKEIIGALTETINPSDDPYIDEPMEPDYDPEYAMDRNAALDPVFKEVNPLRKNRNNILITYQ